MADNDKNVIVEIIFAAMLAIMQNHISQNLQIVIIPLFAVIAITYVVKR